MSDCRNGGRDSYAVPKPVEQATINRMCREFGNPPWTYPVDKPECWPDEAVELVGAIMLDGVRYERVRECEVSHEQDGIPRCSLCQNILYDEYKAENEGIKNFCDECGARVRGGGDD